MNLMETLKAEMARKRKQIADVEVDVNGKKMFKRGDLLAKEEKAYLEKQGKKTAEQSDETVNENEQSADDISVQASTSTEKKIYKTLIADVRKKLRMRSQPIVLFGESEDDTRARLLRHEVEQPELQEGWKNELVTAMQDVDRDLVKEVIEGTSGDNAKHDVALPDTQNKWEEIEHQTTLLGLGDEVARDCDIILSFLNYIIARWGRILNARDHEDKKSPIGIRDSSIHKQTVSHLKPLLTSLKTHNVNSDIRHHLTKICRILILDRNYVEAGNAYMEMAIGNAPWPVGVTRSGIHQRPGSAKSYVSNIAHVLNDETQRKYIQAFKRLMTKMQEYFPTDPSKCVEFVKL